MEYKYFRWNIIIRLFILLSLGYGAIYVLTSTYFWLVSFWLLLAWLIALINLLRYVERSRRELAHFLLSIKQGDFTNTFHHKNKTDLNYAFHEINSILKGLSQEKASNLLYLQTIVEHVRVAVICFDEDFKVKLFNQAAKSLFNKSQINTISHLHSISSEIASAIHSMENGEKQLLTTQLNGSVYNLSMLVTEFRLLEHDYKLVSFQDIKSELESKEIESWQKLIRVLTHEIKNSVIPISTLSEVILQMVKGEKNQIDLAKLDEESVQDIVGGLETIESRSKGLASFVSSYDRITKISKPNLASINIKLLIDNSINLFNSDFKKHNIDVKKELTNIELMLDADLIEQVMINLLKNAIEAFKDGQERRINVSMRESLQQVEIIIADNGPGIPKEILDNIFIPFYTTKADGSGIGLSLSKQILKLHGAQLNVSTSEKGTEFAMSFLKRVA